MSVAKAVPMPELWVRTLVSIHSFPDEDRLDGCKSKYRTSSKETIDNRRTDLDYKTVIMVRIPLNAICKRIKRWRDGETAYQFSFLC